MTRMGLAVGAAAVTLAACGGSDTGRGAPAAPQPAPAVASYVAGRCPVTRPTGDPPVSGEGFDYGNRSLAVTLWPRGRLVAGPLPDGAVFAEIRRDGSIVAKVAWWREVEGPLTIEGERLDASAPPLRADIPAGYGASGFQPTLVTFPTTGCWRVTGRVGDAALTFVTLVRKRH